MNKETEIKNWYLKNFKSLKESLNSDFQLYRNKAAEEFQNAKFPNKKDEEWKYTSINPILQNQFIPSPISDNYVLENDTIDHYSINNLDAYKFVFVNGVFNKKLSSDIYFEDGIIIDSLYNLNQEENTVIEKILNKETIGNNIFNLLNNTFVYDGFVLSLPKGTVINKPIYILNIASDNDNKPLIQPRNFIHLEKNSQAEIIFDYIGINDSEYFTNVITDIFVEENAKLNIFKLQDESQNAFHIERTNIEQKDSSVVKHFSLSFGAQITRNDINANVDGENIECNLYGLYLGNKNQQIDHHTFIEHTKPNSVSNELYKGILDDNAKGIFSGKILVQKEAQKTNAFQSNKSVLLSSKATSNSKPQLEIYADDVKCSHGATVGKLDEEALFYIRSRGVPLELARSMLIRAFIDDVVKEINLEPLREKVNHTIFQHLQRVEF